MTWACGGGRAATVGGSVLVKHDMLKYLVKRLSKFLMLWKVMNLVTKLSFSYLVKAFIKLNSLICCRL